ncbi:MAG: glutamate--tRNA ligase, partial [Chloroflexi bacterium]|nr:glutamate--tRNA ligase [Chloroflexota bacterium]
RIEDTDRERLVPGALDQILDSLRWLGLDWDEGPGVGGDYGPYVQSERLDLYQSHARQLVYAGKAYYCYCSPERLAQMRHEQQAQKQPPRYDRWCRDPERRATRAAEGARPVVRLAVPLEGITEVSDFLRGQLTFENRLLDDFVLLKSDGYPTYHLASVVDDHYMEITHVMRGDEWISSLPRHALLYQAFGWEPPHFIHLPVILGPDRSKLSKRHGAQSIVEYRERGYLPEAVVNFLALLGWSYDATTELLSREELVSAFTLERLGKAPAIFNIEKLEWMNGYYIRQFSQEELAERLKPFLQLTWPEQLSELIRIIPLIQERLRRLDEVGELTAFFFQEPEEYKPDLMVGRGLTASKASEALKAARERLAAVPLWAKDTLESAMRELASELSLTTGQFFGSLRVAITGRTVAPPLFATMEIVGRERTLERIWRAIELLDSEALA